MKIIEAQKDFAETYTEVGGNPIKSFWS